MNEPGTAAYTTQNQSDTNMKPTTSSRVLSKAAQQLGRAGGSANTPKQNRARAENSLLAGRPGRICVKCGDLVQRTDLARHDKCGLWTWVKPVERLREAEQQPAAGRHGG